MATQYEEAHFFPADLRCCFCHTHFSHAIGLVLDFLFHFIRLFVHMAVQCCFNYRGFTKCFNIGKFLSIALAVSQLSKACNFVINLSTFRKTWRSFYCMWIFLLVKENLMLNLLKYIFSMLFTVLLMLKLILLNLNAIDVIYYCCIFWSPDGIIIIDSHYKIL